VIDAGGFMAQESEERRELVEEGVDQLEEAGEAGLGSGQAVGFDQLQA